jgi:hypothetical protein
MENDHHASLSISLVSSNLPPRASLLGLPRELLDHIIVQLEPNHGKKSLVNILCACKALYATILPLLYQRVSFISNSPGPRLDDNLLYGLSCTRDHPGQHIKVLCMINLDPACATAARILAYTPNLTQLTCMMLLHNRDVTGSRLDTACMAGGLQRVAASLVELHLSYLINKLCHASMAPPAHKPSNLSFLGALRRLEIGTSVLLGYRVERAPELEDVLPRGLVKLSILAERRDHVDFRYEWTAEQVARVLRMFVEGRRWRTVTPDLQSVHAAWIVRGRREDAQVRRVAMKILFESAGLQHSFDI